MIHWGRFAAVIFVVALVNGIAIAAIDLTALDTGTQVLLGQAASATLTVMIVYGRRDWWLR